MEQEDGGDRDRRLKEIIQQGGARKQVQPPPLPPQRCPRCDSANTKFCYYNNYSLAQPRYFCKTCKRYWTQGGTLRNVPIGGGSRKGKSAKASSSSSGSQQPPQPPQQPTQPLQQEVVVQTTVMTAQDPASMVVPSTNPFYQGGGGYLTSLAAIHLHARPFDQSVNAAGSSNLGFASGFNVATSLAPQGQIQPPYQFSDQMGSNIGAANSHIDWPMTSEASLWSTISSTTSTSGSSSTQRIANASASGSGSGSSPFNPNQWPDLTGYGPH